MHSSSSTFLLQSCRCTSFDQQIHSHIQHPQTIACWRSPTFVKASRLLSAHSRLFLSHQMADGVSSVPSREEEDQRIQQQIDEALACPCVDDLRSGPCGKSFEAAFSCFLRHQARHKDEDVDMDCVAQFQAMQQCMAKHPEAFAEFVNFQQSGDAERLAAGTRGT